MIRRLTSAEDRRAALTAPLLTAVWRLEQTTRRAGGFAWMDRQVKLAKERLGFYAVRHVIDCAS